MWTGSGRHSCADSTLSTLQNDKTGVGVDRPELREPAAANRRARLVIGAHTRLRLARPLAEDLRKP